MLFFLAKTELQLICQKKQVFFSSKQSSYQYLPEVILANSGFPLICQNDRLITVIRGSLLETNNLVASTALSERTGNLNSTKSNCRIRTQKSKSAVAAAPSCSKPAPQITKDTGASTIISVAVSCEYFRGRARQIAIGKVILIPIQTSKKAAMLYAQPLY